MLPAFTRVGNFSAFSGERITNRRQTEEMTNARITKAGSIEQLLFAKLYSTSEGVVWRATFFSRRDPDELYSLSNLLPG
jgi:hypothetical protein